jgi:hypothetical protein
MRLHPWLLGGFVLLALACGPAGEWEQETEAPGETPAEATPDEPPAPGETAPITAFAAGDSDWMRTTRGGSLAEGLLVRGDSAGNSYTVVTFAAGTRFSGVLLPGPGGVALVSHSPSGQVRWVRTFSCASTSELLQPRDLWVTPGGRSLLALSGPCTTDFGGGTLSGLELVVAIGAGGQHRWSRAIVPLTSNVPMVGLAVSVSPTTNEVVVAGGVWGLVTAEGTTYATSRPNPLLLRYDDRGTFLGARLLEQTAGDLEPRDLAHDSTGRLLALFSFRETVDLGGGPRVARGPAAMLVARLTVAGRLLWDRPLDGNIEPRALGVFGNRVTVAGHFFESITFRGQTFTAVPPAGAEPPSQGFVLGLTRGSGSERWIQLRGRQIDDLAMDRNGGVTVIGRFVGVGPAPVPSFSASFVAKHDRLSGRTRWRRVLDFAGFLHSVGATAGGTAYVTGSFFGTTDLGDGPRTVFPAGSTQAFTLRLER